MTLSPKAEVFDAADLTEDALLGGKVRLLQPRQGYRAATDPVFLAAAVPADPGAEVLDIGCGAGAAFLCLAARVPGVAVTGVEIQPAYADLARRNAAAAGLSVEVFEGDAAAPPPALKERSFDQVFFNPPYHSAGPPAPDAGRGTAHHEAEGTLAAFLDLALRRVRPGGQVTVIHRAERLGDLLGLFAGRAGGVRILPLAARSGRPAKRVIVQAKKGAAAPLSLLAPLVIHAGAEHLGDRPDFTEEALAILEGKAALSLEAPRRSVENF